MSTEIAEKAKQKTAAFKCADCRKSYQDCKCAHYMSESYVNAGGTLADHIAFLNSQRPPTRGIQK